MFCFGTEIGTENRGFSLVSVPNTEILVPWQHYIKPCKLLLLLYFILKLFMLTTSALCDYEYSVY